MATRPSKFQSIFTSEDPEPEVTPTSELGSPLVRDMPAPMPLASEGENAPGGGGSAIRRIGRPAIGKKSNPNYRQVTAYIRKDLYREVTEMLYDEGRGRDTKRKEFSELVDELLERWRQERQIPTK